MSQAINQHEAGSKLCSRKLFVTSNFNVFTDYNPSSEADSFSLVKECPDICGTHWENRSKWLLARL
jgi:hypothetical protein